VASLVEVKLMPTVNRRSEAPQLGGKIRTVPFVNVLLAGAGSVFSFLFIYSAYRYVRTGERLFTSYVDAIPAALAIVFLAALKLKSTYRLLLATLLFSMAVAAYSLEFFLRLSYSTVFVQQMAAKLAQEFGVDIDQRDRYQLIADLRKQGISAVLQNNVSVNTGDAEITPLAGIANKLTVGCNQAGRPLIYESDEHGFNNPKGLWRPGSDIVAVGNSFTLGYCVPSDINFVALIRRRYPATVNLGMPGQGPVHILATLKEYTQFLKPKVVLWFYSDVTFTELQVEKDSRMLMRYLKSDFNQGLLHRQSEIDDALTRLERQISPSMNQPAIRQERGKKLFRDLPELMKLSILRQKLGLIHRPTLLREVDWMSDSELSAFEFDLNLIRETLFEAKAQVEAWGGVLYFVDLPQWERLYAPNPTVGIRMWPQILKLVNGLGIPVIDLYPAFQNHPDPSSLFPLRGSGHYNRASHRLVSETVLNVIASRFR
jgi:hypothetical protein